MESTSELESPKEFFYWSTLAALSAIAADNVCLPRRYFKTYPNIYVMLVADSGKRKGLPVALAKNFVTELDSTRVISGRSTIQAILSELAKAKSRENGKMLNTAKAFLVASEFSASLIEDPKAFDILTDLYDSHFYDKTPWTNMLKVGGVETLKNPCITTLGASNDTNLIDTLPRKTTRGGFLGRMFLVKSNERGKPNSLVFEQDDKEELKEDFNWKQFMPYLREVSNLKGEFKFDFGIARQADAWYKSQFYDETDDVTGFQNRIFDHILKVAMLLSLSRSLDMIITRDDLEESIDLCQLFTTNAKRITEGTGRSELGPLITLFVDEMLKAKDHEISKRKFLRKHYGDVTADVLPKIVDHCLQTKQVIHNYRNGEDFYQLSDEFVNAYEENKKRLEKRGK